ncbi:ribonucleotide reductase [Methanosarcina sp. 2.H.T.1A.6]|uniref:adenosylcobalamin-dependent ribonucleoside-diphosphate reductase n=1 Tax=unclassified Methanosarcina TaxID=2644672 RepID=UPI000622AA04|nr:MULTISPECIES: adenosylcobalamin-dependent ribonucleoside-diphosphate reductase [unclassified Methanosarcina]KKG13272.1 ribonucleotide reductase [Methanosarcina sp. 2.H.T.1A.15]KKG15665.1 ribonucleotide reductase [Methanosarcina sp. 2.H.T.1A.3]KKG24642.1 ribonucleotide reductase [Methanosarcina sp. 2.H.T.1A.6]KKG25760.1 ribonucleotide reductase [Methanosarcina sp. 2.H.T.1A.8]
MLDTEEGWDALVAEALKARYLREGEKGWEDICERVAKAIATGEEEYLEFKDLMIRKIFLPSSPTLMNAGTELGQLAACFVVPVEDSVEEIFDALKTAALIQKTGGGTGFDFSKVRPKGSQALCVDGVASGPLSFMKLFNEATEVIKQFGRRRGANIGILDVSHDDLIPFIRAKHVEGNFRNFNLSVMVPDAFIKLVEAGSTEEVWNPRTGATVGTIFSEIVDGVWRNGEPGVLFYDRINRDNFTPKLGNITATNPCGEEPLLPYESCNLGSINLSLFVVDGKINWDSLRETAGKAVRFLDNEIDINVYPVPEIGEATRKTRKIGLGVMGFHDMLLKLGLPYDSTEALELAEKLMEQISRAAVRESRKLAAEKEPFPEHENSAWELPMRNAALTAIAPTGTISILANCSAGIEPVFSWVYRRTRTVGKEFLLVHPLFEAHFKPELSEPDYLRLLEYVYTHGTLQDIKDPKIVNEDEKRLFRSALDISWKTHIDVQAAFQRHCHAGISKTINMPADAKKEDIEKALIYAWKQGLKGLTIYRTGSRQHVVLNLKKSGN